MDKYYKRILKNTDNIGVLLVVLTTLCAPFSRSFAYCSTDLDIGAEKSETTMVSDFFYTNFYG